MLQVLNCSVLLEDHLLLCSQPWQTADSRGMAWVYNYKISTLLFYSPLKPLDLEHIETQPILILYIEFYAQLKATTKKKKTKENHG